MWVPRYDILHGECWIWHQTAARNSETFWKAACAAIPLVKTEDRAEADAKVSNGFQFTPIQLTNYPNVWYRPHANQLRANAAAPLCILDRTGPPRTTKGATVLTAQDRLLSPRNRTKTHRSQTNHSRTVYPNGRNRKASLRKAPISIPSSFWPTSGRYMRKWWLRKWAAKRPWNTRLLRAFWWHVHWFSVTGVYCSSCLTLRASTPEELFIIREGDKYLRIDCLREPPTTLTPSS